MHETEGQLILNGSYDIGFTNDLALKDLGFAMQFGREFGVPLDLAGMTNQIFVESQGGLRRRRLVDPGGEAAGRCAEDRPQGAGFPGKS